MTDNDTFVGLHIAGLGSFRGTVARTFDDGFAVRFDHNETELSVMRERLDDVKQGKDPDARDKKTIKSQQKEELEETQKRLQAMLANVRPEG